MALGTHVVEPMSATQAGSYQVHSLIGQGTYGKVFLATNKLNGTPVAIKICVEADPEIPRVEISTNIALQQRCLTHQPITFMLNSVSFGKHYLPYYYTIIHFYPRPHPHILSLLHHFPHVMGGTSQRWMVFEYGLMDLENFIAERHVTETSAAALGSQIASGLVHLHSLDLIHRDLKPANTLLVLSGLSLVAKISDMGAARQGPTAKSLLMTPGLVTSPCNLEQLVHNC